MKIRHVAILAAMTLSSCASTEVQFDQASASKALSAATTGSVCSTLQSSASPSLLRAMAQAELAARKIYVCGGANIASSPLAINRSGNYERGGAGSSSSGSVDCSDFSSSAAAQRYFLAAGGPTYDPHNLDGDGDGLACEWAAQVRKIAARTGVYSAPRYRATGGGSSYCHVGPRGGTYTITASGNKNYDGC